MAECTQTSQSTGSILASVHKLSKRLTLKRPGQNDPSTESPAEEYAPAGPPRSSAEDASPRFCLSLPALRRPGDQQAKQTAPFRPSVRRHEALESFPQREPKPSMTTLVHRRVDPTWELFLAGQKTAGADASSYYPSWSVSALGAPFSPYQAQETFS